MTDLDRDPKEPGEGVTGPGLIKNFAILSQDEFENIIRHCFQVRTGQTIRIKLLRHLYKESAVKATVLHAIDDVMRVVWKEKWKEFVSEEDYAKKKQKRRNLVNNLYTNTDKIDKIIIEKTFSGMLLIKKVDDCIVFIPAKGRSTLETLRVALREAPKGNESKMILFAAVNKVNNSLSLSKEPKRKKPSEDMLPLEKAARNRLYYYEGGHVPAIRLFGSDDEYIREDMLHVEYSRSPLKIDYELLKVAEEHIEKKEKEAVEKGQTFFNGPCTRLIGWRASPKSGPGAAGERKELSLDLGPVSWFEYEGLNGRMRDHSLHLTRKRAEYYIGLSSLLREGSITGSRLSNVMDCGVTVLTSDGYIGYQERGNINSSVPGWYTSAVAENINRFLDDTSTDHAGALVNPEGTSTVADHEYQPKGIPHPYATVKRGIREELSAKLLNVIPPNGIRVTGLALDLTSLGLSLLFMVLLDLPKREVLKLYRKRPGKDKDEGQLLFALPNSTEVTTQEVLAKEPWVPGGKASFVRSIELIESVIDHRGVCPKDIFDYLKRHP